MTRNGDDKLVLAAARLRSDGLLQRQIAEQLRVSQPEVSRLLRSAEARNWLVTKPVLVKSAVPKGLRHLLDEIEHEHISDEPLRKTIASLAPVRIRCSIQVVRAPGDLFAQAAAERIEELLTRARRVGVMWGRTMQRVAHGIEALHAEGSWKDGPLQFIPACGEPLFLSNQRIVTYSASALAERLQQLVTIKSGQWHSLIGVPAYIPTTLRSAEKEAIQSFIHMIPGYKAIFLGDDDIGRALVDDLDTILTGIGIVSEGRKGGAGSTGTFLRERLHQEPELDEALLNGWVFGDIGGVLVKRPNLDEHVESMIRAMNDGWTGIRYGHFLRCAERATERKRPGVIVVASGSEKADMAMAVVREGLANELIVDASLADRLKKECGVA